MMLRTAVLFSALLTLGCTVDTSDGMAFESTGASSAGTATTDDSGNDSSGDDTADTSDDDTTGAGSTTGDGGTTGDATAGGSTSGGDGTTGDASGGSSGGDLTAGGSGGSTGGDATAGGSTGGAQGGEAWSECLMGAECAEGMGCLNNGANPTDGFCTQECIAFADPSGCPTAPAGGDALLTCIPLGGQNICALDCAGGKTCPGDMVCVQEQADNGTIDICM